MESPRTTAVPKTVDRRLTWLGVALLIAGLAAHLLSAQAIGGLWRHYRDHTAGFLLIAVVFGAPLIFLGRRFWRGRTDVTILVLGAIQAGLGLYVWFHRFDIH